ncbi:chemotaxis protein CheD [Noviherbaspirillum sedimenti]|uniref:Protein-glutamine glutaminase n=1 Tax=Noviherbaspirillum sedimenti TaxID=2320865 RepID=A0A3A3G5Q8_9BURK|nr:chemotaxis protein CheD [Noviherbaspirillum sedimenti]RJG03788.1 hypothetical protein D3878_21175 [Noviherbaspirillum sedimenti]
MNEHSAQIVGMGELKIGGRGDVLKATLGSCIGIAFLWKGGGRCGLAHCLLSEAPEPGLRIGARYVNQAIPSLLKLMGIRKMDYPDIEVIVAGGARMFSIRQSSGDVGKANAEAAQKYLLQYGLTVTRSEIGGRRGRQIVIDCGQPSVRIKEIMG